MHPILIIGAGKIGSLIALLLDRTNDYRIYLADTQIRSPLLKKRLAESRHIQCISLDAAESIPLQDFLKKTPVKAVVSALPFYHNANIAKLAQEFNAHYFDLTEDIQTTEAVKQYAQNTSCAFVPQCGLAPGFINILAHDLTQEFTTLDTVKLRVGALPVNASNTLQYSLTWSTDGLINEYGNPCQAVVNGEEMTVLPLEGLEEIRIDGVTYEAFNTSGGIGSLAKTYAGKVRCLNYKTIRYPGHCIYMRFLMNDLKLNHDRSLLKRILENALPQTTQDVVVVYASVTGIKNGVFTEENAVKKFYAEKINGAHWHAIQLATASELCALLDIILANPKKYQGWVKQEQFSLNDLTNNRFGQYYCRGKA